METAMKTTFQTIARELARSFVVAERTNGDQFYKITENAPAWLDDGDFMREIHETLDGKDCRLPCDWVYRMTAAAASAASEHETADEARDESGSFADSAVDIWNAGALAWAGSSPYNTALCDEAADEFQTACNYATEGFSSAVLRWARGGQYLGAERIYLAVVDAIEAEAESRE